MHDLIVIGAGTAGCVLADRLTASGRHRVLLIEAGGTPRNRFVAIPAGFTRLFKSEVDWAFESEPQAALKGRRIFTPRGKMLGGSANINGQIHQWCHPADFDGWAAAGATGWGWQDVVPAFQALEQCSEDIDPQGRGTDGPMRVTPNRNARPLTHAFVEAARAVGLGDAAQYNGSAYQGAWISEIAHHAGRRFSVYDGCLKPAMKRSNLDVLTEAQVTGIRIQNGRACGASIRRGGEVEHFDAGGVVLSAGAVASPQLLMISGVGPAGALAEQGISVVHDSPEVGRNLQDHPTVGMVFKTRSTDTLLAAESLSNLFRFLVLKRGMLASNAIESIAFTQVLDTIAPDLELMFMPSEFRDQFLHPPRRHAFSMGAVVASPQSRGRLWLRSPDPLDAPAIDFGLLSDPEGRDARVLWAGLRLCRKIAETAPLADFNDGELHPGPDAQSDEDFHAYASAVIQTVYHPTSTCRMGSDPGAVVDPELQVKGIDRLWVADASVMPSVPRGHPNTTVAMVAYRAADWIDAML